MPPGRVVVRLESRQRPLESSSKPSECCCSFVRNLVLENGEPGYESVVHCDHPSMAPPRRPSIGRLARKIGSPSLFRPRAHSQSRSPATPRPRLADAASSIRVTAITEKGCPPLSYPRSMGEHATAIVPADAE